MAFRKRWINLLHRAASALLHSLDNWFFGKKIKTFWVQE